jgi:hypothetical protein
MSEILLLAVTKMLSGLCIGGVAPGESRWVRPVKAFGTILPGDLRLPEGRLMRPFDVVSLSLGAARPQPPHAEDVLCDFVRPRPRLVRQVTGAEQETMLAAALDPHPEEVWAQQRRSLTLFQPAEVTATFFYDDYSGKLEARLAWPGCGEERGHPVTDLRWRALGRALLPEGGQRCLTWKELQAGVPTATRRRGDGATGRLGPEPETDTSPARPLALSPARAVYLAVGLSRAHEGRLWPMVVGVHLVPDYEVTVDERRL